MRVLLYASECNPDFSSEPFFTFETCRAIVDRVDEAVLVTHIRNQKAIDAHGLGKADVVYIDNEYIARPIADVTYALRLGAATGTVLKYPLHFDFERVVWRRFKRDIKAGRFDIIHRLGPITSALPSPMASWSPLPFVIGPINGGLAYPPGFEDILRKEGEWLRYVRWVYRFMPFARSTFSKSAGIAAAFQHTINTLPPRTADRVINLPEVAADPAEFAFRERDPGKTCIDFVFVGRLIPFKCADVLVSAFAASEALRQHRLHIIGDGPEKPRLMEMVREHGLEDCVVFPGWLAKSEVARRMQEVDVFVFPSIRDSGAGVIAEAMMAGLAGVVVNYGPGGQLIDDESGIRVPLGSRRDHIAGFTQAMEQLAADGPLRQSLSKGARARAESRLTWDAKGEKFREIYDWILGRRAEKPKDLLAG